MTGDAAAAVRPGARARPPAGPLRIRPPAGRRARAPSRRTGQTSPRPGASPARSRLPPARRPHSAGRPGGGRPNPHPTAGRRPANRSTPPRRHRDPHGPPPGRPAASRAAGPARLPDRRPRTGTSAPALPGPASGPARPAPARRTGKSATAKPDRPGRTGTAGRATRRTTGRRRALDPPPAAARPAPPAVTTPGGAAPRTPAVEAPPPGALPRRAPEPVDPHGAPAPPRPGRTLLRLGDPGRRLGVGFAAVCTLLVVLGGRLVQLQGFDGDHLAEKAEQNRLVPTTIPAVRGQILDRDGRPLAYTVAARTIFADPTKVVDAPAPRPPARPAAAPDRPRPCCRKLLKQKTRYVPLARNLSPPRRPGCWPPAWAGSAPRTPPSGSTPAGDLAAAVVGYTNVDGGLGGIESKFDGALAGTPGKLEVERGSNGLQIPGGVRAETAAVAGSTVQLTLDEDLQFTAQRGARRRGEEDEGAERPDRGAGREDRRGARDGDRTDVRRAEPGRRPTRHRRSNPAVQAPVEPGSANKVVTFAAAVDQGKLRPDTPMLVPDGYQVADKIVSDAWSHAPTRWTATGVLAKSSNVGTLMIAHDLVGQQRVLRLRAPLRHRREDRHRAARGEPRHPAAAGAVVRHHLRQPADRAGRVDDPAAAGRDVPDDRQRRRPGHSRASSRRSSPRTAASPTTPAPTRTTVVSPQAARTVRTMLEAVVGEGGTAPNAAIDAYRVAGKTGTAQKPNPACHCYAGGGYWATFAGLAPADEPELVISVVIDQGKRRRARRRGRRAAVQGRHVVRADGPQGAADGHAQADPEADCGLGLPPVSGTPPLRPSRPAAHRLADLADGARAARAGRRRDRHRGHPRLGRDPPGRPARRAARLAHARCPASPPRPPRPARPRSSPTRPAPSWPPRAGLPVLVADRPARAARPAGRPGLRRPDRRHAGDRGDRHQRQDHDGVPAGGGSAGRPAT